jgi:hypothetical protein
LGGLSSGINGDHCYLVELRAGSFNDSGATWRG